MDPEYSHFYEEVFLEISHASRCCTSVVKKQERIKSTQININQGIFTEKKLKEWQCDLYFTYIAIPSGTPSRSQGEKIERMQIVLETQTQTFQSDNEEWPHNLKLMFPHFHLSYLWTCMTEGPGRYQNSHSFHLSHFRTQTPHSIPGEDLSMLNHSLSIS